MICKTFPSGYPGTVELLDLLRERRRIRSDYALARFLKIGDSTIANYRAGRSRLSPELSLVVANELGLPGPYVLACVELERTSAPGLRAVYLAIAEHFEPEEPPTTQRPLFSSAHGPLEVSA